MKALKRYIMLAVLALGLGAISAAALSKSYYASKSVMNTGRWVKVRVDSEGVHQVSYDQLRNLGFSDPSKVKVCGYGGTYYHAHNFSADQPDDIYETPNVHTADGRILFYADGEYRLVVNDVPTVNETDTAGTYTVVHPHNIYARYGYYFLTDADVKTRCQAVDATKVSGEAMAYHLSVQKYENNVQNPLSGGSAFHDSPLSGGSELEIPFTIRNYANGVSGAYGTFGAKVAVGEYTRFTTYEVALELPSSMAALASIPCYTSALSSSDFYYTNATGSVLFNDSLGAIADGEYRMKLKFPTASRLEYLALDRCHLIYPRTNDLTDAPGGLVMQYVEMTKGTPVVMSGAGDDTHVFDITDPAKVYELKGVYDQDAASYTFAVPKAYSTSSDGSGSGRFVAFNASATHPEVEIVGEIANQNIHGTATPQMLVITTDELYPAAKALADMRAATDGLKVAVFTQQQIFNEFSSGTPHANAYRRAAKMFFDRDSDTFKYLLLYGRSNWDPRSYVTDAQQEMLLTYECEQVGQSLTYASHHINLNFATDNLFGMLQDGFDYENMPSTSVDLAVGRLTVSSESEGLKLNDKFKEYLLNLPSARMASRALIITDDADSNSHLDQGEEICRYMNSDRPAITTIKAYNSIYPRSTSDAPVARKLINNSLTEGVGLFDYSGHGRPTYLAAEFLWSQAMVEQAKYSTLPLVMLSSCDTYELDRNTAGIAEMMVKTLEGGSVASIAACRSVYLTLNQYMNLAVCRAYAATRGLSSVGEIYRTAHNNTIKNLGNLSSALNGKLNALCYNLCGDPSMPILLPSLTTVVTEVNGSEVTDEMDTQYVSPLQYLELKGVVLDGDTTDVNFNGTAEVLLYEAPHTASVIVVQSDDEDDDVTLDENLLASTTVQVVAGEWSARLMVPLNDYDGSSNRIVIFATETLDENSDKSIADTAEGVFTKVAVLGDNPGVFEGALPEIESMYIDSRSFEDGDIVPSDFTLYAEIQLGDGGLNVSSSIGASTNLTLDGATQMAGVANMLRILPDNTANLAMPISQITDGRHTLTLSVADNAGNRVARTIAFVVQNGEAVGTLTMDRELVRTSAELDFTQNFSDFDSDASEISTRLIIVNNSGNTVFTTVNPAFPYSWDLKDSQGNDVADGRYSAWVVAESNNRYLATPKVTFTIIR